MTTDLLDFSESLKKAITEVAQLTYPGLLHGSLKAGPCPWSDGDWTVVDETGLAHFVDGEKVATRKHQIDLAGE